MPRFAHFRLVRNLILLACVAATGPKVRQALHKFSRADAFKEMRKDIPTRLPSYLMRLEGVRMKHYDDRRLLTYAHCDKVDLSPDRHRFDLHDVRDALYRGKQGEFRYSANHAVYLDALSQLSASGDVHVSNKDLSLKTDSLRCNGRSKHLQIFGHVVGLVRGGQFDAAHVDYDMDKGAYTAGPVRWRGVLENAVGASADRSSIHELEVALRGSSPRLARQAPAPTTPPADPQTQGAQSRSAQTKGEPGDDKKAASSDDDDKPTVWDIQGDTVHFTGDPDQIATYSNAVATDNEIILIAPTVVHDRKTDIVTATGRIQYFSAKADMVADQCVIYRKEKRAVLTGHVLMFVKPKKDQDGKPKVETLPAYQPLNPDQVTAQPPAKATEEEKQNAKQIRDNKTLHDFPTIVVSEKTEYWYGKGARHAVITGSPQARQELANRRWRDIWSNVGYYDGEKETLKLYSSKDKRDTRMKNSIGDDVTAEWMQVSTKEDDDEMSGSKFIGQLVQLDQDEVPRDKSKPGSANSAKPGSSSPPPPTGGTPATNPPPIKTGG